MNEDQWMAHWTSVLGKLAITPGQSTERPLPDDGHLDRLAEKLGHPLPLSYRTFIKAIGPGLLMNDVCIGSPGYRGMLVDFLGMNKWQTDELFHRHDPRRMRSIAFGYFGEGDFFIWDPEASQEIDGSREYPIYFVPRDLDQPLLPVCSSFRQFIEEFVIGLKFWPLLGYPDFDFFWEEEDEENDTMIRHTEPVFEPIPHCSPTSRY